MLEEGPFLEEEPKIVKLARKKIPWVGHVIDDKRVAQDLLPPDVTYKVPERSICLECRGARNLCGKKQCPIVLKVFSYLKVRPLIESDVLRGSSPPGVFVGRIGYPKVFVGPLIPPEIGDTGAYDTPEVWFGWNFGDIIDFRLKMVRACFKTEVRKATNPDRLLSNTIELAISSTPVDAETRFRKPPKKVFLLDDEVQPMGPLGLVEDLQISSVKTDRRLEKVFYDTDMKASEAVLELYQKGVPVSKIQRAFSMGIMGVGKDRRLVPTRWSITAVDSIISNHLIDRVKDFPQLDEYRIYEVNYLDNRFLVIFMPGPWTYESIEVWFPETLWNPTHDSIFVIGDWEGYQGRRNYARMGGCYYAARLAVTEKLVKEKRQATVLILREAHSGYVMPVGVWFVRESVRRALMNPPLRFEDFKEVIDYIGERFRFPLGEWIKNSRILLDALRQEKLSSFLGDIKTNRGKNSSTAR